MGIELKDPVELHYEYKTYVMERKDAYEFMRIVDSAVLVDDTYFKSGRVYYPSTAHANVRIESMPPNRVLALEKNADIHIAHAYVEAMRVLEKLDSDTPFKLVPYKDWKKTYLGEQK